MGHTRGALSPDESTTGKGKLSRLMGDRLVYQRLFFLIVLLILMLAGFYLRFTYVQTTSPYIDEYTTMWVAQRTLQYGYPVFSTGSIYGQGMLFTYFDAFFFYLFQFSEQVARMPSLIISVCTIPCLYFVGKKMFSEYEGLIAAAMLTFAPQAVLWGGRARNYALIQFLVLWAVFFFYKWAISEGRTRYRYLFILTFIAATYTHNVAMLLFPAFLFCAFLRQGWRWFFRREVILANVLVFLGSASSFYLYRRMRPPGWVVVGVGRGEIGPSFDPLAALERYKPFFLGLDHLALSPILTALCILAIGYLLWRVLKRRSFRAMLSSPDEDVALAYLGFFFGVVVFEMFFIVTDRRWSPRYFFLEAPIFYLIAVHVLLRLVRLAERWLREHVSFLQAGWGRWRAPAALSATALIVLLIGVVSWSAAVSAIAKGEYGYDLAFQYVSQHRQEGDTVMTFALSPCVIYLGESGCDYVAIEIDFHSYATQEEGRWIEAWAGIPILFTDEALREVIEGSSRTWFVVDESRLRTRYTEDFVQYVWDRMDLVAKERGVFVFLAESPLPPALAIQRPVYYNLDEKVALLGYGLNDDDFEVGGEVQLSLRWQGLTHMLQSYSIFVHLVNAEGALWAQHDGVPLRGLHPTTHWVTGEIITDPRELILPDDMPAGRYRLEVGMYLPETMEHLPVLDAEMQPQGDRISLDYILVGGSSLEHYAPQNTCAFNLDGKVTLRGYDVEPLSVGSGDALRVALFWQAEQQMDEDYSVFVHLVDKNGHIWGQKDNQPEGGFYPTSFWDEGEVIRDEYEFMIEPDAPPGEYQIEVGMYILATGQRLRVIGENDQVVDDKVLLGPVEVVR
jgi:4-amino-4-deoxy-L-arabinose transferase-like glycosyltransferase